MRDQKRLLSLNEIWRFLSQEIDKRKLIEEKLVLIEERENYSSDSEEDLDENGPNKQAELAAV